MNIKSYLYTILASTALLVSTPLFAESATTAEKETSAAAGKLVPVTKENAASFAKQREAYPVNTCVISGDKLGSMGDSPEYVYRVEGKPDRFVIFCCDGCEEDFLKEPAKYLGQLDAAAKAKGTGSKKVDNAKAPSSSY